MKFHGQPQSSNFEDRTGWSPERERLHTIATLLNPMIAAGNIHDWMQAHGYAPIHGVNLRPGIIGILGKD